MCDGDEGRREVERMCWSLTLYNYAEVVVIVVNEEKRKESMSASE